MVSRIPQAVIRSFGAALLAVSLGLIDATPGRGQSCLCGSIADEFVAAAVGLDREWVVQVPFDSAAWRLRHVVVGKGLVVAQGGDGTVAAIRTDTRPGGARPGAVAWSTHVAGQGPIEAAGIGERTVAVARGKTLTAIDAASGRVAWELPLGGLASAGALASGGWVYAPLDGGGVYRLPEKIRGEPSRSASGEPEGPKPGESRAPVVLQSHGEVDFPPLPYTPRRYDPKAPVVVGVLWCNTDGLITAPLQDKQFDLGSPASGPPVVHDGDLFVATRAGDLARIAWSPTGFTASSGVVRGPGGEVKFGGWHTVLEDVPEGSPFVTSDSVVISLGARGLAAFSARTGEIRWRISRVCQPLAITDDRVWCLDEAGFLTAFDLASGGRRERVCPGCFTMPVINTASERLVLASPGGLVVSLAPRRTSSAPPPVATPPDEPPAPAEPPPSDERAPADADEI